MDIPHFCPAAVTPRSPYAATLLANLSFWLEEDEGVAELVKSPVFEGKIFVAFSDMNHD